MFLNVAAYLSADFTAKRAIQLTILIDAGDYVYTDRCYLKVKS